jgi:integrase
MSCIVRTNRHGNLCLRLFWQGEEWQERLINRGRPARNNQANRERAESMAKLISDEMEAGTFSYLEWFENGNRADEFKPKTEIESKPLTVGDYFKVWIESKKPPTVRKGLERDYREHFRRYILPQFETVNLTDVTPRKLLDFRTYLTEERGLKLKSARTIIDATFRAMMRDPRKIDGHIKEDPFTAIDWPRLPVQKPDPFTEEERDKIIQHFREKNRFYYPFVYTLFWTGMRLSEALALRWEDIDLKHGFISISKYHYLEENSTKTAGSEREIRLLPGVVDVLRAAKPLHIGVNEHVFKNQDGNLLDFHTWRGKKGRKGSGGKQKLAHGIWYRILRASGVRERKPYTMRHTFISAGLTNGVNIKWLAEY